MDGPSSFITDNITKSRSLIESDDDDDDDDDEESSTIGNYQYMNGWMVDDPNSRETLALVGDVTDKIALLMDDILDSCPSFIMAAGYLKREKHAVFVAIVVTHALLTEDMARVLQNTSDIDQIIVTNTTPISSRILELCPKIRVIDISGILSEAIRRIHNGESVSQLFLSMSL
jgi:phosphoribosylpyrophosphate synthetase